MNLAEQPEVNEAGGFGRNLVDTIAATGTAGALPFALGGLVRGAPDKVDRKLGTDRGLKFQDKDLGKLRNHGLSRYWARTAGNTQLGPRAGHTVNHLLKKLNVNLMADYYPTFVNGPAYSPGNRIILAGVRKGTSKASAEALLGHELGHAVRDRLNAKSKLIKKFYGAPGLGVASLATIAAGLHGGKNDIADAIMASTGALAMAPTVYEELAASNVGARLLRLKGLSKLKTFRGAPTYLAAAAAPAIAIGIRRGLNKLRDKKDSSK